MFAMTGKNALVTGASGAIGAEIAKVLHARGATVVLSGTRVDSLNSLKQILRERAYVVPTNLEDNASIEQLFAQAQEKIGDIDILVNNAGLTRDTLAVRMTDEDWNRVIQVNLTAAFRLCRVATKAMMKRRQGRIINISSVVGITGNPGQMNYCASKAGLIGMSKSLAQEVASRGVTVNCIAPGFIKSNMTDSLNDSQKHSIYAKIPMGKMGSPADIAHCALYLSSDEAAYITGQTLHVNGGMVMV